MFLVPKLDDQIERWAVKHHGLTANPGIRPQLGIHLIVGQLNADFRSGFLSVTERLSESIDYFHLIKAYGYCCIIGIVMKHRHR